MIVEPAFTTNEAPGATVTLSVNVWVPVHVSCPLSKPSVVWFIPAAETDGIEIIDSITDINIKATIVKLFSFNFEVIVTPLTYPTQLKNIILR